MLEEIQAIHAKSSSQGYDIRNRAYFETNI
jgi:hypothetical protein